MKKTKDRSKIFISLICFALFISFSSMGCDSRSKEIVMIVASSDFRDEEYKEPRTIFENEGCSVTVASSTLSEVESFFGDIIIKPDLLISKINIDNYDAIVFVGGGGATEYFNDSIAHRIVKESIAKGKVLAAICIAPNILANAGALEGKKATCFYPKNIIDKGAIYTREAVEQDGKIITGKNPQAAQEFAKAILAALNAE